MSSGPYSQTRSWKQQWKEPAEQLGLWRLLLLLPLPTVPAPRSCATTASKEKEKAIAPRRSTWARMTIKSLKTKNTAAAGRFQPKMTPLVPKSKWVHPILSMVLKTRRYLEWSSNEWILRAKSTLVNPCHYVCHRRLLLRATAASCIGVRDRTLPKRGPRVEEYSSIPTPSLLLLLEKFTI